MVRVLTSSRCLPATLLRERAARLIRRAYRFRVTKAAVAAEELIYCPYLSFRFTNPNLAREPMAYDVLIDAILGHCGFLRWFPRLEEREVEEGRLLGRVIDPVQAEQTARAWVENYILRKQSLRVREIKTDLVGVQEFYYPYWVTYLRKGKDLVLLALDSQTGKRGDARLEKAIEMGIARDEWLHEQAASATGQEVRGPAQFPHPSDAVPGGDRCKGEGC